MVMPKSDTDRIEYLRFMLDQLSQKAAGIPELQLTSYILGMATIEAAELERRRAKDRTARSGIGRGR